jgi:beta-lactamase regulating signal transducer with metallopeptidase domain
MPFPPDLNGEFCLRLTLTLLHFLWQGVAIALLAAGVGAALRRAGAAARYWVFVAALGAMALCPPITYHTLTRLEGIAAPAELSADPNGVSGDDAGTDSGAGLGMGLGMNPGAGLKPAPTGEWTQDGGVSQPSDETRTSPSPLLPVGAGLEPDLPVEQPQPDASLLKRVSKSVSQAFVSDAYARVAPWVAGGYFAGVLAMLARLLLALRGGRGLRRHALPVTEPALRAMFERAAAVLHLRARPALAWCGRVAVPTVVGLLKPTILLPVSLSSGLAPDQIEMLLLHELAHLRRHDHWVNLAQWVVETAMFFHPAVWWVSRRIRAERELACDDCVLAAGVAEASYADSLLRMAELSRLTATPSDPTVALALGSHGSRFSEFGHRVLRLIEGREALESLRPARVWPVVTALIVLLAGCYTIACRPEAEDTRQSNDPLGIQYRGLQVGLSDSLYNPQGEKIGERLNWQYGSGPGYSKEEKRRLIFDFPKTSEPIFFDSLGIFCGGTPAEKRDWRKKTKGRDLVIGMQLWTEMDGQTRQLIGDGPGSSPRDQLDLPSVGDIVLRYYYGPPGKSLYRFSAPFIQDREQRDQGGILCPKQKYPPSGGSDYNNTYFTLKLETPIEKAKDGSHGMVIVDGPLGVAIAYDKTGKRHRGSILPRWGAKSEDWFKDLEFSVSVPIGEIETITIGEKPYEVWVKGVQVTPPGSEEETRNEMAEIARVPEIPNLEYDLFYHYKFSENPDKALRSLSLLRGFPFDDALRTIPSEKFQNQSPEFREQLHQTALRLSQAPTPHWPQGIEMGLKGGWPEFYGLALDHFANPELQNFIAFYGEGSESASSFIIADFFSKHTQELPGNLVPKIQKAISVVEDGFVFSNLMKCLTDKKTSATTEALRALSRDERPAVWIAAFGELSKRQALAPEEKLTPPEKIRLGVVRALNGSWPGGVPLDPDVESALLTILSDGAKNLGPTIFLNTLQRYVGYQKSLRAAVEFLQRQNPYDTRKSTWWILSVIRWINLHYGVNIGEFGNEMQTGYNNVRDDSDITPRQFEKAIADTVTWYESGLTAGGLTPKQPIVFDFPQDYSVGTLENATLGKMKLQGRFEIPAGTETSITIRRKPDSFAFLDQFKSLRVVTLNINGDDFREADFQYLRSLASVQFLDIRSPRVTSAEIEILKDLPKLGSLRLYECRIETGCLGAIQNCSGLRGLTFTTCQLSDIALGSLRFPPQFHYLCLKNTPVSSSAIEVLKQFTGLKHLRLEKTGISVEKLEDLKKSLPDCEVSDPDLEKAKKEDFISIPSVQAAVPAETGGEWDD